MSSLVSKYLRPDLHVQAREVDHGVEEEQAERTKPIAECREATPSVSTVTGRDSESELGHKGTATPPNIQAFRIDHPVRAFHWTPGDAMHVSGATPNL